MIFYSICIKLHRVYHINTDYFIKGGVNMLHIVEKNLRRYFCFLLCCIFVFGVNFGFVNLPRVSAEGQNEVVKLQLIGIKSYYTVQP